MRRRARGTYKILWCCAVVVGSGGGYIGRFYSRNRAALLFCFRLHRNAREKGRRQRRRLRLREYDV